MADSKKDEAGDDLSMFAMPHIAGSQMQLDDRDKDTSADSGQGATFSTPPNSPPALSKCSSAVSKELKPNSERASLNSYEAAISTENVLDKEAATNTKKVEKEEEDKYFQAMPKHVTVFPKHKLPTPLSPTTHLPGFPKVDVVRSDPATVRVGFIPASVETTNLSELPGSQKTEKVITTPPHSSTSTSTSAAKKPARHGGSVGSYATEGGPERAKILCGSPTVVVHQPLSPKAKSIEEADKEREKYAPVEGGLGRAERRKGSVTPSEFSTISLAGSIEESIEADRLASLLMPMVTENVCAEAMSANTCYDLIPSSTKIVVFDTRLRVKKAFFALVANGVRAAPLWEHSTQDLVGMLTISDFINILRHHYKSPIVGMDELENQTIRMWRVSEESVTTLRSSLVQIDPEQSLYDAVKMLVENKIHRLPIIDKKTGNALYILTHKRLLHFLYIMFLEKQQPAYMHKTIGQLGIGTYHNIATASETTPIILALNMFHERRVSALPIVSSDGKAVDIYAKFDVINLAAERSYGNLDITLKQALSHRSSAFGRVHTCKISESLFTIVQRLVSIKVHRLIVVSDDQRVIGIVSLSDVLKFLVLAPHGE